MYYCRDHFRAPLNEPRPLRGSIRPPLIKKPRFQCNPGIDGGVEQKNIEFQFRFVDFCIINYVLLPRSLLGPLNWARILRGSIRPPSIKKPRYQCNPGIDGGVEQKHIEFQFVC